MAYHYCALLKVYIMIVSWINTPLFRHYDEFKKSYTITEISPFGETIISIEADPGDAGGYPHLAVCELCSEVCFTRCIKAAHRCRWSLFCKTRYWPIVIHLSTYPKLTLRLKRSNKPNNRCVEQENNTWYQCLIISCISQLLSEVCVCVYGDFRVM